MDDIPTVSGSGIRRRKGYAVPKAVIYHVVACPVCKHENCPVTSSPPPKTGDQYRIRYHNCSKCKHKFKSSQPIKQQ